MLLGNWDVDQFTGASEVTSNAALIAGCLYMFMVPIVLHEPLIAIMSDLYDRVHINASGRKAPEGDGFSGHRPDIWLATPYESSERAFTLSTCMF